MTVNSKRRAAVIAAYAAAVALFAAGDTAENGALVLAAVAMDGFALGLWVAWRPGRGQ